MALSQYTSVDSVYALAPAIGSFASVNSARIAGYIYAVSADIDSRLSKSYDTPFTDTPPDIIRIASDLTMAMAIRSVMAFSAPSETRWYETFLGAKFLGALEGAKDDLDEYTEGKRSLVNSAGNVIARITSQRQYLSNNTNYKPTFDMRDPIEWQVDTDRTEAEADEG